MSSDDKKIRDLKNAQSLIDHLGRMDFSGTLMLTFYEGTPTSVSRKEEMDPEDLDRFLHRPMLVRRKVVAAAPKDAPESQAQSAEQSAITSD